VFKFGVKTGRNQPKGALMAQCVLLLRLLGQADKPGFIVYSRGGCVAVAGPGKWKELKLSTRHTSNQIVTHLEMVGCGTKCEVAPCLQVVAMVGPWGRSQRPWAGIISGVNTSALSVAVCVAVQPQVALQAGSCSCFPHCSPDLVLVHPVV
jgi:hypothetical protein